MHPDQCFGKCSHRGKNGVGCSNECAKDGIHRDSCLCTVHLNPVEEPARKKRKGLA